MYKLLIAACVFCVAGVSSVTAQSFHPWELYLLAGSAEGGGGFPPTLNTLDEDTDLKPHETPYALGLAATAEGLIQKGTCPTGTSRIEDTATISSTNHYWYYNRLWRIDGTNLYYYAPHYKDVALRQRAGIWTFDEDNNAVIALAACGVDSLAAIKSSGSYLLSNCSDSRGLMQRTGIIQDFYATNAANVAVLGGLVFASNGDGLFAMTPDGGVAEITRPIRDNLTGLTNLALTCDFDDKLIIGASNLVYDVAAKRLLQYSGNTFAYRTRAFRLPDWKPFTVTRFYVQIKRLSSGTGYISYRAKWEDDSWGAAQKVAIPYEEQKYTLISIILDIAYTTRKFQLEITDLQDIAIRGIWLDAKAFNLDDYTK